MNTVPPTLSVGQETPLRPMAEGQCSLPHLYSLSEHPGVVVVIWRHVLMERSESVLFQSPGRFPSSRVSIGYVHGRKSWSACHRAALIHPRFIPTSPLWKGRSFGRLSQVTGMYLERWGKAPSRVSPVPENGTLAEGGVTLPL